jgi:hypothetical protein
MKTHISMLAVASLAIGLFTTGCETSFGKKMDAALFTPSETVTNHVEEKRVVYVTNQTVILTRTNEAGVVSSATNREPVNVTVVVPAHDEIKAVAWQPNSTTQSVATGVAGLVPGYGTIFGVALTAIWGIAAQLRSRKFKDAAISIAQGVEHYTATNPDVAAKLKTVLAQVQADHGTTETVGNILRTDVESVPKAAI